MNRRIFVDMDGTLAQWKEVSGPEELLQEGYFLNLAPVDSIVKAVNELNRDPRISVYILSAVLTESTYALQEKKEWLSRYMPELNPDRFIFTECGKNKADYIKGGIRESDFLLDDHTPNLVLWREFGGTGIKCVNAINNRGGSWQGLKAFYNRPPENIARFIKAKMMNVSVEEEKETEPKPKEEVLLSVWRCEYIEDKKEKVVFIAAYDELGAAAWFAIRMPDSCKLKRDSITETYREDCKATDYCLNFYAPGQKAKER